MYRNEDEVGRGMSDSGVGREDIFLVTKLSTGNFTREKVLSSTRESLKKLGTDYADLLLMHWPNPSVPLEETLGAMAELQEAGSVKHIGVSNFPASMVEEATEYAEVFCNQVEYHPRKPQDELLGQARKLDYLLTAYSPVAKGRITGDATPRRDRLIPRQDAGPGSPPLARPARKSLRHSEGEEPGTPAEQPRHLRLRAFGRGDGTGLRPGPLGAIFRSEVFFGTAL